jgi:hypothetical protein
MNRRSLLKLIGVAPVAAYVAPTQIVSAPIGNAASVVTQSSLGDVMLTTLAYRTAKLQKRIYGPAQS